MRVCHIVEKPAQVVVLYIFLQSGHWGVKYLQSLLQPFKR